MKYFVLALSSILGVLGLALGVLLVITLLAATHGYGARFTSPFMPLEKRDLIKSLAVLPVRMRTHRPLYCDPLDIVRQDSKEEVNDK